MSRENVGIACPEVSHRERRLAILLRRSRPATVASTLPDSVQRFDGRFGSDSSPLDNRRLKRCVSGPMRRGNTFVRSLRRSFFMCGLGQNPASRRAPVPQSCLGRRDDGFAEDHPTNPSGYTRAGDNRVHLVPARGKSPLHCRSGSESGFDPRTDLWTRSATIPNRSPQRQCPAA
jgi:hypothetical protein